MDEYIEKLNKLEAKGREYKIPGCQCGLLGIELDWIAVGDHACEWDAENFVFHADHIISDYPEVTLLNMFERAYYLGIARSLEDADYILKSNRSKK